MSYTAAEKAVHAYTEACDMAGRNLEDAVRNISVPEAIAGGALTLHVERDRDHTMEDEYAYGGEPGIYCAHTGRSRIDGGLPTLAETLRGIYEELTPAEKEKADNSADYWMPDSDFHDFREPITRAMHKAGFVYALIADIEFRNVADERVVLLWDARKERQHGIAADEADAALHSALHSYKAVTDGEVYAWELRMPGGRELDSESRIILRDMPLVTEISVRSGADMQQAQIAVEKFERSET